MSSYSRLQEVAAEYLAEKSTAKTFRSQAVAILSQLEDDDTERLAKAIVPISQRLR